VREGVERVSPDPIPFLRACLNEDAKIARSVTDQQTVESLDAVLSIAQPDATPAGVRAIAIHVVRWDPARVLAEVAADDGSSNCASAWLPTSEFSDLVSRQETRRSWRRWFSPN
jgi:Family of unknown function (DUF6221)